jgi:aspartyl-tRNA(Asn)/glutamyl-tRNA(Gln) amidotransferase subunit A
MPKQELRNLLIMDITTDPASLSAHELAQAIAARRLSPVEVVGAFLDRIAAQDAKLHAFVEVYAQEARLAAEAAEKAIQSGHAVSPLHGVPIALKDLIEIEGKIATGGTLIWRERRAERTATLAKNLIAQGMIVLGKTHTVEFAYGGWGTNRRMGTPRNPWDPKVARTPGGSSSGSGVAVAARLAPWAIGTDTGGSVRLPASFCGLTALKTTIGRVSTYGVLPLSPTLDTPGPMARSVEDVALLYMAMCGTDPLDPHTLAVPPADLGENWRRGVRGMRLARLPEAERGVVGRDVLAAYEASLEVLAGLGAEIADIKLPLGFADAGALNGRIMGAEAYSILGEIVDDEKLPLDEDVRPRIRAGRDISARDYLRALREREAHKRAFVAALAGFDAMLTPTTPMTAVALDAVDQTKTPAHFTRFANLLDLCALALPNGFANDLPTSLQIIGRGYDEETVLRVGLAYQSATDWHARKPPG